MSFLVLSLKTILLFVMVKLTGSLLLHLRVETVGLLLLGIMVKLQLLQRLWMQAVIEDSPVVCNGEANGVATVTPAGGNGGFTFAWDNGETTATATALDAGF